MAGFTCFFLLQIVDSTLKMHSTCSCDIFQDSTYGNTMYAFSEIFSIKCFMLRVLRKQHLSIVLLCSPIPPPVITVVFVALTCKHVLHYRCQLHWQEQHRTQTSKGRFLAKLDGKF